MAKPVDPETHRAIEQLVHEHAWLIDHGQASRSSLASTRKSTQAAWTAYGALPNAASRSCPADKPQIAQHSNGSKAGIPGWDALTTTTTTTQLDTMLLADLERKNL